MMMITHAAVSGAAGAYAGNPVVAFFLGIFIHFILDKVPHVYVANIFKNNIFRYTDAFLTVLFLIFLFFFPSRNHLGLIFGALGGVIVDVIFVGIQKNRGKFGTWHTKRQSHKVNNWFLLTDVLIFALGMIAIWHLK